MQPKSIVVALTLALGLIQAVPGLAAGEAPARAARRAAAAGPTSEDLLARSVFQTLVGEFALQRGDVRFGLDAWNDLARRTRDPKVIERAVEVAGFARQYDLALDLAKLWLEVEPDSPKAQQAQSSLLVMANRLDELAPQLAKLIAEDAPNIAANLMQLNRMLVRQTDKKAVQQLVDRVAAPYAGMPEAHFAMSQAAANAGDADRALGEIEKALQLRPDWEAAALIRAQLQLRQSSLRAIEGLDDFVVRYPAAQDARLMLARLLITEKRYGEARVHFDRLLKELPDSPEVIYPVAMLALQQGDVATGRKQLEKLLNGEFHDKSAVHFFLGQLDEEQALPEPALAHYRQVTAGDQFLVARSRAAQILRQQGRLEEAREILHGLGSTPAEKTQFLLAEAQLLREAGREPEALALLESALLRQPENLELLYETALLAERQGKPEVLESRLKKLLALKPDHAHALNALGYSWADRNIHLGEAEALLVKAVRLAPDDPFIMDSMGWVLYRQGKLNEALQILERAYALKADPEIAAHLGEVLWRLERKDEARQLLDEAARRNPDNDVLAAAIKKLLP